MLTAFDGPMLADAFPANHRALARSAGDAVSRVLFARQWTERFSVQAGGQSVLIPARLHFASVLPMSQSNNAWRFARALQTRSNDGYVRQRAVRDVIADLQPWGAPFIVALIGEYIVEILDDIYTAMTTRHSETLAAFIVQNEKYWGTTKHRVTSYWNAYYRLRPGFDPRQYYSRDEYIGFKLINRLEAAAFG